MTIHTLPALKDNFIYVLVNGADAAVIDPGETAPVRKFLDFKRLRLTHILCTHHHHDHVDGARDLMRDGNVQLWASAVDGEKIPGVTRIVNENDDLKLFNEPIKVIEVPGHTLGQVAFYLPKSNALFTGDTLFSGGCGRIFEGTFEQMFRSLQKIKHLPMGTRIYFGHEYTLRNLEFIKRQLGSVPEELFDYEELCRDSLKRGLPTTPTNLAQELKINPFLYSRNLDEFTEWREARNHF